MSFITVPFAWLLNFFYDTFHNYGIAILLFGLLVKIIMEPFQMKSKHSMMRSSMLAPRIKDLEKRYGSNKQKYQEEVSKLYKAEKINPASGCIWSIIPFPILIALYSVVRLPLTRLMGLSQDQIAAVTDKLVELGVYTIPAKTDTYVELTLANLIHENFDAVRAVVANVKDINFNFLGLNLSAKPQWDFFGKVDWSDVSSWAPALGLFLIPFISAGLSLLTSLLSQRYNPPADANSASTAKTMLYTMPLVSVYICFIMPAAMGLYWIVQSFLSCIEELVLGKHYRKVLERENAKYLERERARQAEIERKRQETERLKAEGKSYQNTNTSRKKLQAQQKAEEEARRAAAERAARAERRARMGIPEPEIPESQVGNRRYARGRAYVANRFDNPESAKAPDKAPETVEERAEMPAVESEADRPREDFFEQSPEIDSVPGEELDGDGYDDEDSSNSQ